MLKKKLTLSEPKFSGFRDGQDILRCSDVSVNMQGQPTCACPSQREQPRGIAPAIHPENPGSDNLVAHIHSNSNPVKRRIFGKNFHRKTGEIMTE